MTNYFTPETCKQLQQLGCVASSGMARPDWKKVSAPVYGPHDFLSSPSAKENLIRVFREKSATYTITGQLGNLHGVNFITGKEQKNWEISAYQLLDIILSGGDGESFIKEALKGRDE